MKTTGLYPRVQVDPAEVPAVGKAGGVLLTETVRATGLDQQLVRALAPWRRPLSSHDPGKILLDLALMLALGGVAWPMSPRCGPSQRCLWPGRLGPDGLPPAEGPRRRR